MAAQFRRDNARPKQGGMGAGRGGQQARPGKGRGQAMVSTGKARGGNNRLIREAPVHGATMSRRGLNKLFDPTNTIPLPAIQAEGKAFSVTGMFSHNFEVHETPVLMIATNTGCTSDVGYIIPLDINYATTTSATVAGNTNFLRFSIPTLDLHDTAGGPSAARPMRFGVSVVNCTNLMHRGGRVFYLNSAQRLPYVQPTTENSLTTYDFTEVVEAVKATPVRQAVDGADLKAGQHLIGFPTDTTQFHAYNVWKGKQNDFDTFLKRVSVAYSDVTKPMSVQCWIFEPTTQKQSYEVTIRSSYYTRWPLTTIPGQKMSVTPTAHPDVVNGAMHAAELSAHTLQAFASNPKVQEAGVALGGTAAMGKMLGLSPQQAQLAELGLGALGG